MLTLPCVQVAGAHQAAAGEQPQVRGNSCGEASISQHCLPHKAHRLLAFMPTWCLLCQLLACMRKPLSRKPPLRLLVLQSLPESLRLYNVVALTLGPEPVPILGLRVWNYNKSAADTARGAKRCIVLAGAPVASGGRMVKVGYTAKSVDRRLCPFLVLGDAADHRPFALHARSHTAETALSTRLAPACRWRGGVAAWWHPAAKGTRHRGSGLWAAHPAEHGLAAGPRLPGCWACPAAWVPRSGAGSGGSGAAAHQRAGRRRGQAEPTARKAGGGGFRSQGVGRGHCLGLQHAGPHSSVGVCAAVSLGRRAGCGVGVGVQQGVCRQVEAWACTLRKHQVEISATAK